MAHGFTGALDGLTSRLDPLDAVGNQRLDFTGGLGGALGQVSDLSGHHSKATPLFARASGFHSRIKRQNIGLECDAVDDSDDLRDAARAFVDAAHRGDETVHCCAGVCCGTGRFTGQLVGPRDVVGIAFPDGKVLGDKGNVKFRFTAAYMNEAAKAAK